MKQVVLFDGETIRTVQTDMFFQDEWVSGLKKTDVEEAYINTLTLKEVVIELSKDPETAEDQPSLKEIDGGNSILRGMLRDMYGDHDGNKIINKIEEIHYEKSI
jgi:hypothetical protein